MRVIITLRCDEPGCGGSSYSCGGSSYSTTKNKRNTSERIQLKKYCKRCKKIASFKETK